MLGLLPLCPSTTTPKISGKGVEFNLAGQNRPSCNVNIFNPSLRSLSCSVAVREGSKVKTKKLTLAHFCSNDSVLSENSQEGWKYFTWAYVSIFVRGARC